MTAPIETPATVEPEVPPVVVTDEPLVEDQSSWEKFTPEMRDQALREGKLPPVETPPEPPEGTPPVEPPETPPAEPPVKPEEPPEPPPAEPVKPEAEPPAGEPPAKPEEPPKRLYAGQYETVEAMEKALTEKQGTIDRQGGELGELRKQTQPKPEPEPEDPEPVRDQFDEGSLKAHDEWLLRQVDRRNKQSEERIAQGLGQYDKNRPVRRMIEQFTLDHEDVSPEKRLTIAQHADNMARTAGKPVSLEEAYADLFGAKTETPSKPGETPTDDGKAAAIVEASKVPTTVADVPTAPPPDESSKGQVNTQAEWNSLPDAERERRRRDIPPSPPE